MINNYLKGTFNTRFHLRLFKSLLLTASGAGLIIYLFIHLVFYDFPINITDELVTIFKLLSITSLFAASVSLLVLLADVIDLVLLKKRSFAIPAYVTTATVLLVVLLVTISSCNTSISAGIKKDFNTGMSSSYTGMDPDKAFLVMNNEILNHTDIPIGESFLVVNDGIKGMQSKNGKVKVGCSLSIIDKGGKVLLTEKDLFAGHDEFEEAEAKMLKCTVSTGEPMKSEEKYDVAVTFWDKNGTGKIENKVTIRSIDMP